MNGSVTVNKVSHYNMMGRGIGGIINSWGKRNASQTKPTTETPMQAQIQILNKGNTAIQEEKWQIPLVVAQSVLKANKNNEEFKTGGYWHPFAKNVRRCARQKSEVVITYTAGFSSSELARFLDDIGADYAIV